MFRSILALVLLSAASLAGAQAVSAPGSQLSTSPTDESAAADRNSQFSLMAYITLAELKGKIPDRDLIAALDDDGDGIADAAVWAQIQTDVQEEIDGTLGRRYATPFGQSGSDLPSVVKLAAKLIAIEAVYNHRNLLTDKSPERAAAKNIRLTLVSIADGEEPLSPDKGRSRPSASAITEKSRTHSDRPAI